MTKADELCKMLDERSVEYTQAKAAEGPLFIVTTNKKRYFILVRDSDAGIEIWSRYLTPEQAITAILGVGTCHEVEDEDTGFIVCSECGAVHDTDYTDYYCWCCGAKVVNE